VLLGVGEDGHIASLFPDHPAVHASGVCVGVPDAPKPPPERLTLTLSVLEEVEHTVLVATGAAKASMLRRALAGDASLPLGRYRPRGEHTWVLDPAAAAELPRT
jgi:6-phosphogluconolactonase